MLGAPVHWGRDVLRRTELVDRAAAPAERAYVGYKGFVA